MRNDNILIKTTILIICVLILSFLGLVAVLLFNPTILQKVDYRETSAPINLTSDTWHGGGYLGLKPDKVARINLHPFNETNLLYYSRVEMTKDQQSAFLNQVAAKMSFPSDMSTFKNKPQWIPSKESLQYIGVISADNGWHFYIYTNESNYLYLFSR